jgi:hypothetical protein
MCPGSQSDAPEWGTLVRDMRRISLPIHALVELVAGLVLVVGAFALDLGTAGTVLTFAAGVSLAGLGLGAVESLPLAVHQSLDRGLVIALSAFAVVAALDGGALAAVLLLAVAVGQLALMAATRWSRALTS